MSLYDGDGDGNGDGDGADGDGGDDDDDQHPYILKSFVNILINILTLLHSF